MTPLLESALRSSAPERDRKLPVHVAMLTNIISPHQRELYEEIARRVAKLTVLISAPGESDRGPDWRPEWGPLDVRVQRTTTFQRPWHHPQGFEDVTFLHIPWDTISQLRRLRPDVVIASELGCRTFLSACYTHLLHQVPLVIWAALSEHTEQGRSRVRVWLRRWLVRRASALIVNGASGEHYMRGLGFDRPHVFRAPYCALSGVFDRCPATRTPDQAHRLLYVGQLIPRKGILRFTRAVADWAAAHPGRHVEFSLVGAGPLEARLAALPTPANLELRLLGPSDYRHLAASYADAGILAFPTLADEWGLVVNEAMAAGLPVLGSLYAQAVEELCVDGVTGWTFRPDHREEMMRALDRALETPADQLDAMRSAAREMVRPLHPENTAGRVMQAIEAALEDRAGGGGAGSRRGSSHRLGTPKLRLPKRSHVADFLRRANHVVLRAAGRAGVVLNALLGSRAGQTLGILAYHRIVPPVSGVPQPPDNVTPAQFHEQLSGLLARGFRILALRDVLKRREEGREIPRRTVVVTFDDGHEGLYAHAMPVLEDLGVPATVFVATAYLDTPGPFPFDPWGVAHDGRVEAEAYRPLSTPQCRQMVAGGLVELGSHTHTHGDFRGRPDELRREILTSLEILEERFGSSRPAFAFPFGCPHRGFADDELLGAVRQSGVACGLSMEPVLVDPRSDPFGWGRLNVFPWDTSATLAGKLGGWFSWLPRMERALFCLGRKVRRR